MDDQNRSGFTPQNIPPNPYASNPTNAGMPPQALQSQQQSAGGVPPNGFYPAPSVAPGVGQLVSSKRLTPEEETAKKKKLLIFAVAGITGLLLIIGIVVALVFTKGVKPVDTTPKLTKRYDSPAAIAAPFQSGDIKNGHFKLTARYITGNDFVREGSFFVEDGRLSFEMIPDDTKVNELIRDLYIKQDKQAAYSEKLQGATKNFRYDFMSFLGYHYLNDVNLEQGFIPVVEAARDDPELAAKNKALRLGNDCNAALSELKGKIDGNMQITDGLSFDMSREGIRTEAVVAFSSRQSIDGSIIRFLENCYDHKREEAAYYKAFTEKLRQNVTPSPTFVTWEQGGKYMVQVRDLPADVPFAGDVSFELSEFDSVQSGKTGETASYAERRNQYGLAYSYCRVEPVVTTTIKAGYRFLIEDTAYGYPLQADSGYYCTTAQVPSEFAVAEQMTLKLDNALVQQVDKEKMPNLKAAHDLEHQTERFHQENNRYPNLSEFTDIANNNLGDLVTAAQQSLKDSTLRYVAEPTQCIGDCSAYTLTYQYAPDFRITRYPF